MNGISINVDKVTGTVEIKSQFYKDLNATPDDLAIVEHFTQLIHQKCQSNDVTLERRSNAYLTLLHGDRDFLRFKYTDRTKWLSVAVDGPYISNDNPLFVTHKNKNERFWKSPISDLSDLQKYDEIVLAAYAYEWK